MKIKILVFVALVSLCLGANIENDNLWNRIKLDNINYYGKSNYNEFGLVLLLGGIMANTNIDQTIRDYNQTLTRNKNSDEQGIVDKSFGEGKVMIPLALLITALGDTLDNEVMNKFGEETLRAYLVGAPLMLLMQRVTGGSRPQEVENASKWKFWKDENGVSGHAFMGSIPFLVASKLTDNDYFKYALQGASVVTALSRINDDAHFASQALLGWYMGNMAVDSVCKTEKNNNIKKNKDSNIALSLMSGYLGYAAIKSIYNKSIINNEKIIVLPLITDKGTGIYFSITL